MRTITRDELIDILRGSTGCKPVTIIANVDGRLRKTGNPYAGARKVSEVNGMIGWIYQNAVNRQRVREAKSDDFEPLARGWGQRVERTPLVVHKEAYYLELKVQRVLSTSWLHEGREIDEEEIREFMPAKAKAERQGLDTDVILRDYALSNIQEIRIDGERLIVND